MRIFNEYSINILEWILRYSLIKYSLNIRFFQDWMYIEYSSSEYCNIHWWIFSECYEYLLDKQWIKQWIFIEHLMVQYSLIIQQNHIKYSLNYHCIFIECDEYSMNIFHSLLNIQWIFAYSDSLTTSKPLFLSILRLIIFDSFFTLSQKSWHFSKKFLTKMPTFLKRR